MGEPYIVLNRCGHVVAGRASWVGAVEIAADLTKRRPDEAPYLVYGRYAVLTDQVGDAVRVEE